MKIKPMNKLIIILAVLLAAIAWILFFRKNDNVVCYDSVTAGSTVEWCRKIK